MFERSPHPSLLQRNFSGFASLRVTENEKKENAGQSKTQRWKTEDRSLRHENSKVKNGEYRVFTHIMLLCGCRKSRVTDLVRPSVCLSYMGS